MIIFRVAKNAEPVNEWTLFCRGRNLDPLIDRAIKSLPEVIYFTRQTGNVAGMVRSPL
jgi:hypothetical protein